MRHETAEIGFELTKTAMASPIPRELIDFPDSNPYPPIEAAPPDRARHASNVSLLRCAIMNRTLLILGLAATSCVVGTLGTAGWFFYGDTIQEYLRRRPFDAAAWKGEKTFTNDVRIRMVDDLLRRHSFRGMTREQVIAILGEPDKTEYFNDWDMVYWLGPERGFMGIDSECLVFRLDVQRRIIDLRIVSD